MRKYIISAILLLFSPSFLHAKDFLGVPVLPDARTVSSADGRLEFKTGLSHDKVLAFYQGKLKSMEDIKYREWKDVTYIEDDGNRPWHSITISKGNNQKGTIVVISKDNWTWIIGTLILRFIGVFFVLLVVFAGMKVYGIILKNIVRAEATK